MEDIDSLKKENRELHDHIIGCRLLVFLMSIALIGLIIGITLPHKATEEEKEALIEEMDHQYSKGYDDGKSEGYDEGYSEGYDEGEGHGYDKGYSEGKDDGYKQGYREGSYSRPSDTSSVSPWTVSSGEEYRNNYLKDIEGSPISDGYIGNKNTHKFHLSTCSYLPEKQNRIAFDSYDEAISNGYDPCLHCNP